MCKHSTLKENWASNSSLLITAPTPTFPDGEVLPQLLGDAAEILIFCEFL